MPKKLTQEEFIKKAHDVHGDKYDYSKVQYVNGITKVCIVCPIHGEFWQVASSHLQGHGCKECDICNRESLISGVGFNDMKGANLSRSRVYKEWRAMLYRCYAPSSSGGRNNSYVDCEVCEEWLTFSNFKRWFEDPENGYQEGYHLDKDILVKGNKKYSPTTCCFVPREINLAMPKNDKQRGNLPIGVSQDNRTKSYRCSLSIYGKTYCRYASSIEEAFEIYKYTKEDYLKRKARDFFRKGAITKKVYNALMNYEVEITD